MNKFIVLEGLDGSGKSTQVDLLKGYFDDQGVDYKFLHFPQTNEPYFGEMIARFLRGEFGPIDAVDPYLVAMLYAGDRHAAASEIREWLSIGSVVVVDRYVLSNIAFQCAKIQDDADKTKLRKWIFDFEYNYYKIPKPGLSIFLDVPMNFVIKNLENERKGNDRAYLQGKQDIHEAHAGFQEVVRKEYLEAIKLDNTFEHLNCIADGSVKPANKIFNEIRHLIHQYEILK